MRRTAARLSAPPAGAHHRNTILAWGDTGVFTRGLKYINLSDRVLQREAGPSLSWSDHGVRVELGMRFDFGGPAPLKQGASFTDLDDVTNHLHRFQSRYVIARTPINNPILAQFNSWYLLLRTPKAEDLKRYAGKAAALGLEAFVINSG